MFTGIVEAKIPIVQKKEIGEGIKWTVSYLSTDLKIEVLKIGDSLSINGVCHTITDVNENYYQFFSSKETLDVTNLKYVKLNDYVNIERSLMMNSTIDGHFVYGHVDTVVSLKKILQIEKKDSWIYQFEMPRSISKYIVSKGSVAINGISLTVYEKNKNEFSVMIIPHTKKITNIGLLKINEFVNIECDVMAKYAVEAISKYQDE